MKSITLEYDGDAYCLPGDPNSLICVDGLRGHIVLPRPTPERLRIVFTKTESKGVDSFQLYNLCPSARNSYFIYIEDVDNYLLETFRKLIRQQWRDGHRFFHFTYEQE